MRITQNISASNSLYYLQQGRARLDKLAEQIGSGANINRPSDDPNGTSLMLSIGDQIKAGDQYASNISKATTFLKVSSTALQGMADIMQLSKQLANGIFNGSSNPSDLASAASQLTTLKQQLVDLGNTQLGNQYVFGGANGKIPFDSAVTPPPYYSGDETAINVEIGKGATQLMNVSGSQLLAAGTEASSTPYGATDVLKTIDDLITAIGSNNVAGIQTGAKLLGSGADQITRAQTDVASRLLRLDSMSNITANNKNTLETIVGNTQNIDYAKLGMELNQQQTAFNASLSSAAKISQLSLLDYL